MTPKIIQPGGTRAEVGRVFDVQLDRARLDWGNGQDLRQPQGLYLAATGGAVRVLWTVGDTSGGGNTTREFQVTRSGALLNANWQFAKLEIVSIANGATLAWAWTVQQPSTPPALLLTQDVTPGTYAVPGGAFELIPGQDDASFAWSTNDGSGAVTVPWALTGGLVAPVAGDEYTATVANQVTWRMFIP